MSSVSDYEYLQFALRITEDIIRNDLYTNKGMRRVCNRHLEANRGRLDVDKMNQQIENLCNQLNIPLDESQDDDLATRSQIKQQRQTTDTVDCTYCSLTTPLNGESKDCECETKRCLPLECAKCNNNTSDANEILTSTGKSDEDMIIMASEIEEDETEKQYYKRSETAPETHSESNRSLQTADMAYALSSASDIAPFMKVRQSLGCIELPSVNRLLQRTRASLDNQSGSSGQNTDVASGFESATSQEMERPELLRFARKMANSLDPAKRFPRKKSISFSGKVKSGSSTSCSGLSHSAGSEDSKKVFVYKAKVLPECSFGSIKFAQSMATSKNILLTNDPEVNQRLKEPEMTPQTSMFRSVSPKDEQTEIQSMGFGQVTPKAFEYKQSNFTEQELLLLAKRGYSSGGNSFSDQMKCSTGSNQITLNEQESCLSGYNKAILNERLSTPFGSENIKPNMSTDIRPECCENLCSRNDDPRSEFQVLQLKDLSNMKMYGLDNKEDEFVLIPGPIYVPKSSILCSGTREMPSFAVITPQLLSERVTSAFKQDAVVSTHELPPTLGNSAISTNPSYPRTSSSRRVPLAEVESSTYSNLHGAALQTIHYPSYASALSRAPPEVSQPPPVLDQFLSNEPNGMIDRLQQQPKVVLKNRYVVGETDPYFLEQDKFVYSPAARISQLNDYDLTPQRDLTSTRSNKSTSTYLERQPELVNFQSFNTDRLLLGDEYEIADYFSTRYSNLSAYDRGLPQTICKFYPSISTQTQSSDWLLPPIKKTRKFTKDEIDNKIKPLKEYKKESDGNMKPLKELKKESDGEVRQLKELKKESDGDVLKGHKKQSDGDVRPLKGHKKERASDIKPLKKPKKEIDGNIISLKVHKKESDGNIKLEKLKQETDDSIRPLRGHIKENGSDIKPLKELKKDSDDNIRPFKGHKKESDIKLEEPKKEIEIDDNITSLKGHKKESDGDIEPQEIEEESDDNIRLLNRHKKESDSDIKLEELKNKSDNSSTSLKEYKKESDGDIKTLDKFLTESDDSSTSLKGYKKESDDDIKTLEKFLTESDDSITSLKGYKKESDDGIKKLEESLTESENSITSLKGYKKESGGDIKPLEVLGKETDDNIGSLKEHEKEGDLKLNEPKQESDDIIRSLIGYERESDSDMQTLKELKNESNDSIISLKHKQEIERDIKLQELKQESYDSIIPLKGNKKESDSAIRFKLKNESDVSIISLTKPKTGSDKSIKSSLKNDGKNVSNKEHKLTLKFEEIQPEQKIKDKEKSDLIIPFFETFSPDGKMLKNAIDQKVSQIIEEHDAAKQHLEPTSSTTKEKYSKERSGSDYEESSTNITEVENELETEKQTTDEQLTLGGIYKSASASILSESNSASDNDIGDDKEVGFYKSKAHEKITTEDFSPDEDDILSALDAPPSENDEIRDSIVKTIEEVTTDLEKLRKTKITSKTYVQQKYGIEREKSLALSDYVSYQEAKKEPNDDDDDNEGDDVGDNTTDEIKKKYIDDEKNVTRCCGLIKTRRKSAVHADDSLEQMPNISSIPDDQLYEVNKKRSTIYAERKSLRFDYSTLGEYHEDPDMKYRRSTIAAERKDSDSTPKVSQEFEHPVGKYPSNISQHSETPTVVSFDERVSAVNLSNPEYTSVVEILPPTADNDSAPSDSNIVSGEED